MPATITTHPPQIAFSRNPIPVVVTSPEADYLAAAAANSVNFLTFAAGIVADTVFVLSWATGSATMTAKDAPDDSGLQFPTGDGSNGYVSSLLEWFSGNPFLSRDFDITVDTGGAHPQLIFTAKLPGPDFDITTTNGGASGNTTPGVTDQPVANFAHHIESWIKTSSAAFAQAYSCNVPLDGLGTGDTSLEIQRELHAFLSPDVPVMGALYAQCFNSIGQYYLKTAQYKGSDPSIRKISTSATWYINKGGLSTQASAIRNLVSELQPVTGDNSQDRFLRQGSKNKLVVKSQPEWLTWLNLTGAAVTVSFEVIIHNADETTHTFYPAADIDIPAFGKFQFKAGYNQINVAGQQAADKMPVYYTCRIISAGAYLTDIYAFVVDYNHREFPRAIVYENSFGAFQTIGTVGKLAPEFDRSGDTAALAVGQRTAALTGDQLETNIFIQDKGALNIGYARANTRSTQLLRDLMVSESIYLYDAGTLIPIGIDAKNMKLPMDGTNVFAGAIPYFVKYDERTWSEPWPLIDDSLGQLLADAGSTAPAAAAPPEVLEGNYLVAEYGDVQLSAVGGHLTYTYAPILAGRTNYRIYASQLAGYLRTEDVSYNLAGSFSILIPGFSLNPGDQLIIWPLIINPTE